ncbi:MAG TPA: hypothetical protein VMU47_01685 [Caldimonas sp.]|nr:hypothetical protein [Caldimonas sp.]
MFSPSHSDRSAFRPSVAAALLTAGAALGALGTMAALGQAGLARASGPAPAGAMAMPAAAVAPRAAAGGFDGVDHSVPPAPDAERNVPEPVGDSSPTF